MTTFNLTCEAVDATLDDYLDGTLETWVRESIEEHLEECARCAGRARDLRNLERQAALLPPLVPERDIWPEVANDIGVPAVASAPVTESEPVIAPSEPPVVASIPLQPDQPSLPVSEASLPTSEAPLPMSEEALPASEPAPRTDEPTLPTSEPSLPGRALRVAASDAQVSTTAPAVALLKRREKRLQRAWMGLAAAALVLVTAGTTFLATVRWMGPNRASYFVTETPTRRLPAGGKPGGDRAIGATAAGPRQIASDSLAPSSSPDSLGSSLTLATTAASQVTRSPDEIVYDKEIKMLQAMRRRRTDELDAPTAAVIERNLRIIDSNIAQIRAALQKDPDNSLLDNQVSRALDMKVEILRRVAMLQSNT